MKLFLFMLLSVITLQIDASDYKIIPEPLHVTTGSGKYVLPDSVGISSRNGWDLDLFEIQYLKEILITESGIRTGLVDEEAREDILIRKNSSMKSEEAYLLVVSPSGIEIEAGGRSGLFYAIQTLRQMLWQTELEGTIRVISSVVIQDQPQFSYRGLMLDPARHFLPINDLKSYIDVMALYKYNRLHLHLSDDQGWRMEIKKYPRLTSVGSVRRETDGNGEEHRGFYTQNEMKELVAYADERHVAIIPEIDIPGHSVAAIAAYPELTCFSDQLLEVRTTPGVSKELLCAGNEQVFKFLDDIIGELAKVFPGNEFHIGGDEAPLDHWGKCPKCQKQMKQLGLSTSQQAMSYFFGRVNESLEKYKKRPLLWYELDIADYPQNSIMYSWRMGLSQEVIQKAGAKGYHIISSPGEHAYFDYPQAKGEETCDWMPLLTLEKVYQFDPFMGNNPDQSHHVIGVEGTLWGEYVKDIDRAFYMTWPRGMALAEAGWSSAEKRSWSTFIEKLDLHFKWMQQNDINFRDPVELENN